MEWERSHAQLIKSKTNAKRMRLMNVRQAAPKSTCDQEGERANRRNGILS